MSRYDASFPARIGLGSWKDTEQMHTTEAATAGVRAWGQVAAAISLVADGRYPRVAVTGIPDAPRVAEAFRPDAARCGVEIILEERADRRPTSLMVQRR